MNAWLRIFNAVDKATGQIARVILKQAFRTARIVGKEAVRGARRILVKKHRRKNGSVVKRHRRVVTISRQGNYKRNTQAGKRHGAKAHTAR